MKEKICTTRDLKDGEISLYKTESGNTIVIVTNNDHIYAFDSVCPHAKGDLSKGRIENETITCLHHELVFNLHSGDVVIENLDEDLLDNIDEDFLHTMKLKIFSTEIIDNELYIIKE